MGRKSKGKRQPKANSTTNAPRREDADVEEFSSHPDLPEGAVSWAMEIDDARKLVKKNPQSIDASLRVSRAYLMMRRWEELENATTEALRNYEGDDDSGNDERMKQELLNYQKEAKRQLKRKSRIDRPDIARFFQSIFDGDSNIDDNVFEQMSFYNLNCLQYSAISGDVRFFDKIVALGAAIDYPPMALEANGVAEQMKQQQRQGGELAPPTCTALILVCASLAMYGVMGNAPGLVNKQMKETLNGNLECAIQLVRLGADCQAKLILPSSSRGVATSMWRQFQLHGKTAQELANISGKKELIDTMKLYEGRAAKIRLAHCRCGSRLPWKECHAATLPQKRITSDKEGQLVFLYSPSAPCPCKKSNKTFYKCCWNSPIVRHQNDKSGEIHAAKILPMGTQEERSFGLLLCEMKKAHLASGGKETDSIFGNQSPDDLRKGMTDLIRKFGLGTLESMDGSKSKIRETMDSEVYAGILERLDDCFHWRDDHWSIDKYELLSRVKEWNDALDQYCDDMGISGEERESTIKRHKASPYAPCANPPCKEIEANVKEFKACARCRTVAYCSKSCQAADWKLHKLGCIPR
mmetsp:Transcript_14133/g.20879  ORF Transcript_14133/g.20879 Transcript_14133/m.20879 type:complete len:581 (-) Transcript_14133:644-2386(-)